MLLYCILLITGVSCLQIMFYKQQYVYNDSNNELHDVAHSAVTTKMKTSYVLTSYDTDLSSYDVTDKIPLAYTVHSSSLF